MHAIRVHECLCVYVSMGVCVCVYACIHCQGGYNAQRYVIYIYICMYIYIYIYECMCIYVYTDARQRAVVAPVIGSKNPTYTLFRDTNAHICMCIHTSMHKYIHTRPGSCGSLRHWLQESEIHVTRRHYEHCK